VCSSFVFLCSSFFFEHIRTHSMRRGHTVCSIVIAVAVVCALAVGGSGSEDGTKPWKDEKPWKDGSRNGTFDGLLPGFASYVRQSAATMSSRLQDQLTVLRGFSDDPYPAVTRVLFTEHDVKARAYVRGLMVDAGLEVTVDGMGSIIGSWRTDRADWADWADRADDHDSRTHVVVMTGSHTDAIPLAGAYDGVVGVLGGIEAIRLLREFDGRFRRDGGDPGGGDPGGGARLRHPVEFQVVMFASEEPTRFGLSCVASRVYGGVLGREGVEGLRDGGGIGFEEAARGAGVAVDVEGARAAYRDDGVTRAKRRYFVELHIEQGKELEDAGLDIGIVTHIAGPASVTVSFKGPGGHAGGLMMRDRHDASLAAAELALDVEGLVKREGSSDTVGTVGSWQVSPNAVNSVPREVVLGIDVRDIDGPRLDRVVQGVKERAKVVAEKRGVEYAVEVTNHDAPATSSGRVVEAVGAAAGALKLRSKKMVSRAYHDSLFMGLVSEMGMIFIPCEGGKSHRPDEFASERDVLHGTQTLALTMGQLGGLLGEDALRHDDQVGTDERHSEL
jgi:ureidoglycolate amidohydrolase